MAAKQRYRARAPSPKNSEFDSDNTYSLVQDSMRDRKMTQVARIDRMFGDSANEDTDRDKRPNVHRMGSSKFGSVSSNSTNSSSLRGGSLASLYQARKLGGGGAVAGAGSVPAVIPGLKSASHGASSGAVSKRDVGRSSKDGGNGHYDAATVEQIKKQFQAQIEAMMLSQERNSAAKPPITTNGKLNKGPIKNGHIPSAAERELNGIKDIQRGKTFLEARSAVQKHIENMLTNNNNNNQPASSTSTSANRLPGSSSANQNTESHPPQALPPRKIEVKHSMHGVSHAIPGEMDGIEKPLPVHYGVDQAIRSGSVALKAGRRQEFMSTESLTSIVKEPSLARGQSQDSVVHVRVTSPHLDIPNATSSSISPGAKQVIPLRNETESSEDGHHQRTANNGSRISSAKTPTSPVPSALKANKEYVRHKVDYLGALPISASRSTNLAALQRPLKDLYFKWRALRNLGHSNLPGTLEINDTGLTVQYIRELHKGVQEIFNPFPTIAVWAAVKFVHKRDVTEGGRMLHRFAFLPLISDPEGRDKSRLFHDLESETEVELAADNPHPPIFACVMRRQGSHKQLECHGFVCNSSEDAIIIAANLYQALLETMKKQKSRQGSQRRSGRFNKDTRQSASGDQRSVSIYDTDASGAPIRPPRRKKKSGKVSGSESSVAGSILQRRKSVRSSVRSNRSIRSSRRGGGGGAGSGPASGTRSGPVSYNPSGPPSFVSDHPFRRSGQLRRMNSRGQADFSRRGSRRGSKRNIGGGGGAVASGRTPGFTTGNTAQGDVYTRVAIPRSKSFMNVNSQYNLQELFKELKEKEGVESIDDVLKKVISPNGISFNEIKPVYRELLLKLAMTMSQDELFQRSKNIMSLKKTTQEKKKNKAKGQKSTNSNNKKNNSNKYPVSASEHSTLSSFLKLNFSSSKQNKNNAAENNNNSSNTAATNTKVAYADSSKITKRDISGPMPIHPPPSLGKKTPKTTRKATSPLPPTPSPPGSSGSSSGNPHRHHQAHHRNIPTRNGNVPAAPTKKPPSPPQDDDAYYSCSECGYESVCTYDTCSCSHSPTSNGSSSGHSNNNKSIPPPKAYQTEKLNIIPPNSAKKSHNHHHLGKNSDDVESVVHDCDTESCISEEKCYCSLRGDPRQPANHTMSRPSSMHLGSLSQSKHGVGANHHNKHGGLPISDSESCCTGSHFTHSNSEMSDSATDTTCYSVRHVPLHQHHDHMNSLVSLSGIETPQTAWRRNSKAISPDVGSDTYSDAGIGIMNSGSSASTSGSCKMCEIHHRSHHGSSHHGGAGSDDEHSSALSRKNSGGSGYQSNDSCCSSHQHAGHQRERDHHRQHGGHHPGGGGGQNHASPTPSSSCHCTSACSSCQTSLAGSLMSNRRSRPKLSLPTQHHSHINLSAAGLGSPMENSSRSQSRGRSSSPQKVLLVSAVDKNGKMMYSSNSNLELIGRASESSTSGNQSRMHHHQHASSTNNPDNDEAHVMSMKKSAEIAAVFSGAKINQMTEQFVDPHLGNPDEIMELSRYNNKSRQQYSESNMHSSLGYFP